MIITTHNTFYKCTSDFFECLHYRLWVLRVPEMVIYIFFKLIFDVIITAYDYNDMEVPVVNYVNGTTVEKIANNTLYSYPLKFDSHLCWPHDLSVCTADPDLDTTCCEKLYDEDSWPQETFEFGDIFLAIGIFIFFNTARILMWHNMASKRSNASVCNQYWMLVFVDAVVSCFAALIYSSCLTQFIKRIVGSPRPIYYALKIYASVHADTRSSLKG